MEEKQYDEFAKQFNGNKGWPEEPVKKEKQVENTPVTGQKPKTHSVKVVVQKRSGFSMKEGKHVDYKKSYLTVIVQTMFYGNIKQTIQQYLNIWLDENDAYITKMDIRSLQCDIMLLPDMSKPVEKPTE